ncbi:SagB/ThcOx family dehydrogenase [Salinispora pacifica]|uniref:SagB/ThcOx family dehydrogenase n=1 Tax=Salinispora pacifica TaxID=351187 RepID=UPI0004B6D493|nr:SagB family peptide dehydrogenase [Salinispora pacifica]
MSGVEEVRIRLRPGVSAVTASSGEVHLVCGPDTVCLGVLDERGRASLIRLADGSCTGTELPAALDRLLVGGGWAGLEVGTADSGPTYALSPVGRPRRPEEYPAPTSPVLSRFAVLRRAGAAAVLESPLATQQLTMHDPTLVATLTALIAPVPRAGSVLLTGVSAPLADRLWACGLLTASDDGEAADLAHAQWRPHELWFHHESRDRTHRRLGVDFGGTTWAKGVFPALPAVGNDSAWRYVPLPAPQLAGLPADQVTLSEAIESRRSYRSYDEDRPIRLAEISEFLYRCARVRARDDHHGVEMSDRPYPSGGRLHELEIYLLVRSVDGLESGLYHYDPFQHGLARVPAEPVAVRALLRRSAGAMAGHEQPQVLILLSARFGRLMWKYESMGYALVLKHVGVLMQTMYLVATAMGLAPCALGTGDVDLFAAASGRDSLHESSVGEFALGSRRAGQ